MKIRILTIVLALIMTLSATACDNSPTPSSTELSPSSSTPQTQDIGQSGDYISIEKSIFPRGGKIAVTTTVLQTITHHPHQPVPTEAAALQVVNPAVLIHGSTGTLK